MAREVNFGKMLHGGDYNPEQWLHSPEILEKDIEYFKKAKINEVSLGIFSWAVLEPVEGEFHFEWMEKIIDRLYENGISTILATPTGARPRWMAQKYPEVLRVDASRHRNLYGERHNHCYTSPVYREKTRIMNTKLAEKFKDHPGVIAWHISNEYGGECHCPLCQAAFKNWLKDKYQTVDKMNRAWATTFWSHRYNDFDQVDSPSPRGDSSLHGLNLDWKRFVTDQTVDFVKWEIQALRDAGSDKPTTINMMYDFQGLNYHKFADVVDFVSWDNYPQWHKKEEYLTAMDNGMQHDIMRSIQKKPFLLMENCPSATNWQSVSKLKKPGMLHAASMQAVAHGSDSILYFQLRQSQGSSEKFHGAVIDHYGKDDTRVFKEVMEVGESLEKLQEVTGAKNPAQVAVVYDWENRWAMEDAQDRENKGLFYKETVEKSYYAFRKQGLNVDMIDMEQDLDGYKVVAAPMLYMFRAGFEEKVRKYVENGGTFILTYWSGIVDSTDLCFLEGTPHGLMDVMGLRSTEIDGLYDGEYNRGVPVRGNELCLTKTYTCNHLCELVKTSTAQPLMTYETDFYAGMPALTVNLFGKGKAYHVCADFEQGFYDEVYRKIAKEAGVKRVVAHIPEGVEVSVRRNQDTDYVFVQNFNRQPVEVKLPVEQYPVWLGKYDGTIDRFGTVVLKGKAGEKGMIQESIVKLVQYGLATGLVEKEDKRYTTNKILELLQMDAIDEEYVKQIMESDGADQSVVGELESILGDICDYAYEHGLMEENSVGYRDLFDTKVMSLLVDRPSNVIRRFWELYKEDPVKATDAHYKFSQDTDYIRRYRIAKDMKWVAPTEYGDLDITINLSKPEKDPKAIAAAKLAKQTSYPKCLLCMENEGYAGRLNHPARQNHRIIPVTINNSQWGFQYSPYVYYNEHCIVFNSQHVPMKIERATFAKLFDFVKQFPHYFVGSNADLPIVGGSILSHDHFQGGHYEFAMAKAPVEKEVVIPGFEDVKAGIVKWPMSVIRISGPDTERLIELADKILLKWRGYTDEEAFVFAETDGEPHNTITPIARKRGDLYEMDLVLRNNITTAEHPLGVYHPHAELHHIKKENIGLIEVMGLAVLPARLKGELEGLCKAIVAGADLRKDEILEKHADWVDELKEKYTFTAENVEEILKKEIGIVFMKVLEHAGVYKCTEEGRAAFMRFIKSL